MMSVLKMAKRSKVRIFNPEIRLNPIHGADLAIYICDLMDRGDNPQSRARDSWATCSMK